MKLYIKDPDEIHNSFGIEGVDLALAEHAALEKAFHCIQWGLTTYNDPNYARYRKELHRASAFYQGTYRPQVDTTDGWIYIEFLATDDIDAILAYCAEFEKLSGFRIEGR